MKILFIHNNYASNTSGEEHAAEALERLLVDKGHQVAWYRRYSDVINHSFLKKLSAFFLGLYNPKAIKEIRDLLEQFEPDVVQIQNLYPFISPAILNSIRRKSIPIVMRCPNYRLFCPTGLHMDGTGRICEKCLTSVRELHCVLKNCENNFPKSIGYALRNFMARTVWGITRRMDAYIVQTAFQKAKFAANGIAPQKIFVVPGITPFRPLAKTYNSSGPITFIGRVSEEKGIREFVEAARILPELSFAVAGKVHTSMANLRLSSPPNIQWKGFLTGENLDEVFSESRIIVVPSKWFEGFPNVLTQAMKLGKPIITTDLGAMSSIIENNKTGLLVRPGDAVELARAIMYLAHDSKACKRLGTNARIKADTFFTSQKVYEELMNLYQK